MFSRSLLETKVQEIKREYTCDNGKVCWSLLRVRRVPVIVTLYVGQSEDSYRITLEAYYHLLAA